MQRQEVSRPKILHLIASLHIGGTERQLVQFINRSSSPRSHRVVVFDDLGPLASDLPVPPIKIGSFGRRPRAYPGNLRAVARLRRLIRDMSVDLVHAHLGVSEVLAAAATPRTVPLLAARRGRNVGFEGARWLKLVEGWAHRRADLMLCNSQYLADYTREHDLWPPPIRVVHNAVDLEVFRPLDLPPMDRPTIVQVANLKWYKRQELLLRALPLIARSIPDVRAVLVGDGVDRPMLERLARELRIVDRVEFAGQVLDTRPYLARGHVVTLTSLHEGFPNALLEAMASGRPIVATAVGGIPELVRDGIDGVLAGETPAAFAAAVVAVLADRGRLAAMSRAAAQRAAGYGWDRLVTSTERIYTELLAAHGSSRSGGTVEAPCVG